jgi:hypothetical protein
MEDQIMKARLIARAMVTGHAARDYLREVQQTRNSSAGNAPPNGQGAQEILESFQNHNRPLPADPAPPVKNLTAVLTRGLQGMHNPAPGYRNDIGAALFKGARVRLVGIPERLFVVREVFWDYGEVRIKEKKTGIEYVVPWDCLEMAQEKGT